MKNKILPILLLLLISFSVVAQKMDKERIKLLKTSYITDALNLTSDEAEKFWPVYNKYSDKILETRSALEFSFRRDLKSAGGMDALSEDEALKILNSTIELEKDIVTNKVEMNEELKKVLSAKKILKLQKAERDFNRRILQEYGRRRKMQGQK